MELLRLVNYFVVLGVYVHWFPALHNIKIAKCQKCRFVILNWDHRYVYELYTTGYVPCLLYVHLHHLWDSVPFPVSVHPCTVMSYMFCPVRMRDIKYTRFFMVNIKCPVEVFANFRPCFPLLPGCQKTHLSLLMYTYFDYFTSTNLVSFRLFVFAIICFHCKWT